MANTCEPTFFREPSLSARGAEVPAASWTTGLNLAGSNAPGIGINLGAAGPIAVVGTPEQFTLEDQDGDDRDPQVSQHLGGVGYVAPGSYPSSGGASGKGVSGIRAGENASGSDGSVTSVGTVHLLDLTGWTKTT